MESQLFKDITWMVQWWVLVHSSGLELQWSFRLLKIMQSIAFSTWQTLFPLSSIAF
jgi:hypothetical protein